MEKPFWGKNPYVRYPEDDEFGDTDYSYPKARRILIIEMNPDEAPVYW